MKEVEVEGEEVMLMPVVKGGLVVAQVDVATWHNHQKNFAIAKCSPRPLELNFIWILF